MLSFFELREIASWNCDYFSKPCNEELVWCKHQENKNKNEGNCQPDDCPIIKEMTEKAIEDLFGDGSQFKACDIIETDEKLECPDFKEQNDTSTLN